MNIQQIIFLWKAYFIENWKRDLWFFEIAILFAILFPSSIHTLMLVYMFIYAEKLWTPMHTHTARMHFLTTPAGYKEKTTAYILLYNAYFIPVTILSLFIGWAIISNIPVQSIWFYHDFPNLKPLLPAIYIVGSTIFFGNIYFKKNASLKILVAYLLGGLLMISLFFTVAGLTDSLTPNTLFATPIKTNWYILGPIIILFFYFLSYMRLKETEA